jgi:hypothetical protein
MMSGDQERDAPSKYVKGTDMKKEQALRIVKLLSALEVAGLMRTPPLPDYLYEQIGDVVAELSEEILK